MIQLRTFQLEDAEKIISWVDSPLVFYQWCAGFLGTYPITAENLRQYYEKEGTDADYHVLTAFHEQGIFAHLTMRFLKEDRERQESAFSFWIQTCAVRAMEKS